MYFEAEQGEGIVIGGEGEFTPTDKKNLDLNTKTRHTHENKTVLDGITGEQVNKWDGYEKSKEDTSNKVTELSESSTNEEYPTAKAVTEYVENSEKETAALLKKKSIPYTTVTGYPISISDHLEEENVIDYKVYGNSVQNGTPTPDNPVQIQYVGDLVTDKTSEYYGKYSLPVEVCEKHSADDEPYNSSITNIYLDEPLRRLEDHSDYIDFKNQKVVRWVKEITFDGTEKWLYRESDNLIYLGINNNNMAKTTNGYFGYSTHFLFDSNKNKTDPYFLMVNSNNPGDVIIRLYQRSDNIVYSTADEFRAFLAEQYNLGNPVKILSCCYNSEEENITLPALPVSNSEVMNIATGTQILPSNIELTYYRDTNKVLADLTDEIGGFWGLDLPLIKTITLEESVSSIDILSSAEGIELQEFTVLLFIKALGNAVESNISNCIMCLRTNGGGNYFGYKDGYYFPKENNSFAFWHTKIYNKQFALTDLYSGYGNGPHDIPYMGFQGLSGATPTQYSSYTFFLNEHSVDNLNIFISSNDVSRGAIIPQGSMLFLLGR